MKKFIKQIAIFLSLLIGLFLLVLIFNTILVNTISNKVNKSKHILILGDSNSACAIDDELLTSSYNLSTSAESYFYSYLKLKMLLSSEHKIDTVLISFSPHNIFDNGWLFDDLNIKARLKVYLPLMDKSDISYLLQGNPKSVVEASTSLVRQTVSNLLIKLKNNEIRYGGYLPLDRVINDEDIAKMMRGEPIPFFEIPENFQISISEVRYLHKIIETCQKHNIYPYLINFPKSKNLVNFPNYGVTQFHTFYEQNFSSVAFIDLSTLELPRNYYGDIVHLNKKGSEFLSKLIEKQGLKTVAEKNLYARHTAVK